MTEVKEIREMMALLWDDLQLLKRSIERIESEVIPPPQEEGNAADCIEWLRDIPGGPNLSHKRSLNNLCGRGKLFQPGRAYKKVNGRRVFIRSKVIEAVEKSISQ